MLATKTKSVIGTIRKGFNENLELLSRKSCVKELQKIGGTVHILRKLLM